MQTAAIRDVPVCAFHGDQDQAIPVRGSRRMIQALRKAGGNPRYTEVAGPEHDLGRVPNAVRVASEDLERFVARERRSKRILG